MKKHHPFLLVQRDGKSLLSSNQVVLSYTRCFTVLRGKQTLLWYIDAVVLTSANMAKIK